MKTTSAEDEHAPPTARRDVAGRRARPRVISGGSVGWLRARAGSRPLADGLELLDPARCVLLRAHRAVVDRRVDVGRLAGEQGVDQPGHLVRDGDDRLLVRLAHHQASVLGRERALGHSRGVGAFAQDEADDVVALAGAARLALARTLVVSRAQRGPAGQPLGRAEAGHVVADLDDDQRSGCSVDAGNGLQQAVRPGVALHSSQQFGIDRGVLIPAPLVPVSAVPKFTRLIDCQTHRYCV